MNVEKLEGMTNKELLEEVKNRGFFVSKVPPTQSGKIFTADVKQMSGNKFRFGVVSCTHIGSKYQQLTHLHTFYDLCKRRGANVVLHCGDLVDGEKIYRGQEYELFLHGADAQVDYAVENYPKIKGISTKVIMGNHDESFYRTSGVNVVKEICEKREDMDYLGDYLAYVQMGGIKVAIMHSGGGVAYSRSYKPQKIVEQLSSESKPHMIFIGHWHVTCYIPQYRNVETYSIGAFQSQTPYLVRAGLNPNVSGLICEVVTDKTGLKSVKSEWIPFYVPTKNDY